MFDPPLGFALADSQSVGQYIGQRRTAQRFGVGIGGQPVDDLMVYGGHAAGHHLAAMLQLQQFDFRQGIQR